APAPAAPAPKPAKKAKAKAKGKPTPSAPSAVTAAPATLNDRGKALIDSGRPAEAIAPLAGAVQGYRASGQTTGLPYAYALYNLGNALRLAGRPAEAIPYLEERLRVSSNQRPVVERELAIARRQADGN
ncbi:MAG TPA: tetratricopeptide repeat protein, partial [Solirubrobacteraceae bacterium]|nr:tetratricopeptide repeat protein [Solirubrobacteraceae bacterium]